MEALVLLRSLLGASSSSDDAFSGLAWLFEVSECGGRCMPSTVLAVSYSSRSWQAADDEQ